jgi:hypothetical protein
MLMGSVSLLGGALATVSAVLAVLLLLDGALGLMAGVVRHARRPKPALRPDPFPDNVVELFGPRR